MSTVANTVIVRPDGAELTIAEALAPRVTVRPAPGHDVTVKAAGVLLVRVIDPPAESARSGAPERLVIQSPQPVGVAVVAARGVQGPPGPAGPQGPPGIGVGSTFVHAQGVPATVWTVTHGQGRYPSVTVVDSSGAVCVGDVRYNDANTVTLTFSAAFSGTAYLN